MQKSILITGCSTGIGLCAAQTLQDRGWLVIASCRQFKDINTLESLGLKHVIKLDLSDDTSIESGFEKTLEIAGGKLDAVFNNGAYGQPGAVEDLTTHALRLQFETNVFGTHTLTGLAVKHMLEQGEGRIVQNSSVLGLVAMPFRGAYNASKFALEGLTDTLRLELKGTQVKVSLIEPGPIETAFRANALIALKDNVDIKASRHKEGYEAAMSRLSASKSNSSFTLPSDAVVKKLIHALESDKPKARYFVTFPTYLMAFLKRIFPIAWLDAVLIKGGS
ncbi:oxidoreductase [Marinomonas sp. S3726]|uniref:SDR family NAD(P)-dependent oxidoreductase n=1 Tax=Marinomonas sp. S3726 TaxID=579484 RepID=UPI0005FA239B|nr:SDR family NAD(P)-dependent oxidoreductase [Marinomonas sp. S3726]KJZ16126.1 oxidoreductase [Marinomonas sp. S3726]